MIGIRNYQKVKSIEEAWELNQKKSNRVIGGMLWLKMGNGNIQTAIDLSDLGLDQIEENQEEFRIGSMVSLRQLETHQGILEYTNGAMKEALRHIVGVQFRNLATVGGSIYGRYGFSDVLTMFLAMDTYVELHQGGVIPLEEFAKLEPNRDILVRLIVKKKPAQFAYQSVRNTQTDFPVLTCCACKDESGYAVVIGARPEKAIKILDQEGILKAEVDEDAARKFAKYVNNNVPTRGNMRGTAQYRSHLVEVLTRRIVIEIGGQK